ncbi:hypothetical protein NECAME_04457 [Necator americanus]|uniref:Uncharacterized protein n=1 Tax=Necator americanus TaxID=51031 RepID=W2SS27_NECAM|nr:hypothetical protein NECAME_04457 [Necator americanus]ETN72554.1 hypothetical protein NECAME_04457 [Necator americanus]
MSLKEFTGLDDTKEEITELPVPSWKCSTSPSSLISSFSARRRSVLSTELPDSPSKKLSVAKEESIDIPTAINRISNLQSRLNEASSTVNTASNSSDIGHDREKLLEESKRMAVAAKDLSKISSSSPEPKWSTAIAEITDCADCLTAAAKGAISSTSVYHSQLVNTEVTQVLEALYNALCAAQESRIQRNDSLSLKAMTHLQSTTNQLLHAVSTTIATAT